MEKIKVGIVNYLNTRPLLYGIQHHAVMNRVELVQDYPSNIAQLLLNGSIDVGLVPVAIIPHLKESHIITDYCIGCDGPVASVCLFSEVPIEDVQEVLMDYQSRTSVALAKFLLRDHWKISPRITDTKSDYRSQIKGATAGLVIGDRALEQRKISPYIYDLGEAWKSHTGLPFVFAAWVSNKKLPEDFVSAFNEANRMGRESIEKVASENPFPVFDLRSYYTVYINYMLDAGKQQGLERFLEEVAVLQQL